MEPPEVTPRSFKTWGQISPKLFRKSFSRSYKFRMCHFLYELIKCQFLRAPSCSFRRFHILHQLQLRVKFQNGRNEKKERKEMKIKKNNRDALTTDYIIFIPTSSTLMWGSPSCGLVLLSHRIHQHNNHPNIRHGFRPVFIICVYQLLTQLFTEFLCLDKRLCKCLVTYYKF